MIAGAAVEDVGVATFTTEVVLPAIMTTVCEPVVCRAITVVDGPEPIVIEEPSASVCPETINCDAELAITVLLSTMIA